MNIPSIATSQQSMTNKLLVVGHPESSLEVVLDVMHTCNISVANKLQKEDIQPQEISQVLLKAHNVDTKTLGNQVKVNSVWNGLAMDLMMSNLEHSKWAWAWADSDALTLLDYWKSLDETLGFILVYNSPQKTLLNLIENLDVDLENDLEQLLEDWKIYNRTLLNFFYRNQDKSILVNSEQVQENSKKYLQEVGKQIGLNNDDISKSVELLEEVKQNKVQNSKIYDYFVSHIVSSNEEAKQLYMELESIANLPSLNYAKNDFSLNDLLSSYVLEQKEHLYLSNEFNTIKLESQEIQKAKEALNKQLESDSKKLQETQTENELLLTQLMNVQEELEKNYVEKKSIENQLKERTDEYKTLDKKYVETEKAKDALNKQLESESKKLQESNTKLDKTVNELTTVKSNENKIEKEKEELTKKLQQENKNFKELEDENELLLEQLHLVQEELERYYLENKQLRTKQKPTKPQLYGAGERIKQQLSYRLGAKMIENSKTLTGTLGLPFTLYGEVKKFREEKKRQKKQPPIHTYVDAYEAERAKKHLSYRLGQAVIQSMKSPFGLFKLPFALKSAHTEYKKEKN